MMKPATPPNDTPVVKHRKGNRRADSVPLRMCVVTRERARQTKMVRFALSPDGVVTPDVTGKLPGRGVWALAERKIIDEAVEKAAFSRGFKAKVTADDGLSDLTEQLLVRRCQNHLSLAKKSGALVIGFDQVRAELPKKTPGWLLEASDGSADGRNKVQSLAKALYNEVNLAGALTENELGASVGRAGFVHGLLQKGPFAKRWGTEYKRLTGFRSAPEEAWLQGKGG